MLSQGRIEDLRDTIGAMVEMGEQGPFAPQMRQNLAAVWNALSYILEDGSPHAATFERNWKRLMDWCKEHDIRIVKLDPPTELTQ